ESTDPEALRALLARYFERMRGIVESHGGTVEKFIGDAVMAVFGVPVAHEDEALRACRAAVEMRDALPELGIRGRIGVNTGEVVKQIAALPSDPAAASVLRLLLGESEQATSADEISWAFRRLVEEQAPLVVCLDDIQWGEETFLDLVEATALLSAGAPILLLC